MFCEETIEEVYECINYSLRNVGWRFDCIDELIVTQNRGVVKKAPPLAAREKCAIPKKYPRAVWTFSLFCCMMITISLGGF